MCYHNLVHGRNLIVKKANLTEKVAGEAGSRGRISAVQLLQSFWFCSQLFVETLVEYLKRFQQPVKINLDNLDFENMVSADSVYWLKKARFKHLKKNYDICGRLFKVLDYIYDGTEFWYLSSFQVLWLRTFSVSETSLVLFVYFFALLLQDIMNWFKYQREPQA